MQQKYPKIKMELSIKIINKSGKNTGKQVNHAIQKIDQRNKDLMEFTSLAFIISFTFYRILIF